MPDNILVFASLPVAVAVVDTCSIVVERWHWEGVLYIVLAADIAYTGLRLTSYTDFAAVWQTYQVSGVRESEGGEKGYGDSLEASFPHRSFDLAFRSAFLVAPAFVAALTWPPPQDSFSVAAVAAQSYFVAVQLSSFLSVSLVFVSFFPQPRDLVCELWEEEGAPQHASGEVARLDVVEVGPVV